MSKHRTPRPKVQRSVRVLHKVGNRMVSTECRSVRDSNVPGFIELTDLVSTQMAEAVGPELLPDPVDSLVLPKIVVVAICYPRPEGGERVVLLHPAEEAEQGNLDD